MLWSQVRADAKQVPAMSELQKKGVTFVRWSDEELAKFKRAWNEILREKSAQDSLFKEIATSMKAFRKDYSIWQKYGYLH